MRPRGGDRRSHRARTALALLAPFLAGCGFAGSADRPQLVWGKRGQLPGEFVKPRAIAIDADDRLYLVDMRAKIQVFTSEGQYLTGWSTPTHAIGRPSGLAFDRQGRLLVADSHYHQILIYTPEGQLVGRLGGDDPNEPLGGVFGYIADVAVDSAGNLYIAEGQQNERMTKVSPEGSILKQWGGRGPNAGQFLRIRAIDFDRHDRLYVADACNHRIQVFDTEGRLLRILGRPGKGLGELDYPFDVAVAPDGTIYVCEYGNHRIQHFTSDGRPLGSWGTAGREEGQLYNPWALAVDRKGRVHVVDSNNHRVQRVAF